MSDLAGIRLERNTDVGLAGAYMMAPRVSESFGSVTVIARSKSTGVYSPGRFDVAQRFLRIHLARQASISDTNYWIGIRYCSR